MSNNTFYIQNYYKQCFKKQISLCDTQVSNLSPPKCRVLFEWPLNCSITYSKSLVCISWVCMVRGHSNNTCHSISSRQMLQGGWRKSKISQKIVTYYWNDPLKCNYIWYCNVIQLKLYCQRKHFPYYTYIAN